MLRTLLSLFIVLIFSLPALARQSLPLDTGRVTASLISDHDTVAPGQSFYIALRTELDDHWHTYWRNPGDSGEPVQMDWVLPEGVTHGDIVWPLPRPIATGPIINYGFEGTPLFPVQFTIPTSAIPGEILTFTSDFYYLVCKDVCIPEDGSLSLQIMVGEPEVDTRWDAEIRAAIAASPTRGNVSGAASVDATEILSLQFTGLPDGDYSDAYYFPYDQGVLAHSEPQAVRIGTDGIEISTRPDYAWDSELPASFDGVLTYVDANGDYRGTEVALAAGQTLAIGASAAPKSVGGVTLIPAIFMAFIGGLILNLMPCVFPIISLKALSLAKSAHSERREAKRDAWLYTLGVLATFMVLIGVLLALKAAGASLGWGFQLQSPKVAGVLALLMFVIGLNLLGVFEFGSRLQNTGGSLTQRGGKSGSFFTGALAVIVATPCTAPLMAGAMGYALAQPALITVIVFLVLGLGFAAPFLLLGYVPALLSKLPKPGPWMVRFKEFLAFPMFATAIWLAWVVGQQVGSYGLSALLISALLIAFGIWLWQRGTVGKAMGAAAIIAALILPMSLTAGAVTSTATAKADTIAWSPETVASLRAEGRPVFVDFTADWCVTCKVNERLVLDTEKMRKLFKETDTAFVVADWTNKNDKIAQELASYGRAGVPLYLVYRPDQNSVKGQILPQVLTYSVVEDAIRGSE
ncbi:protein-disulfide reductase DsbD family protein [Litorimonas sp. RW-G-Af-16]|uniref:protein-disulfide reductase DsbD family protein n=1 Tax=Litorimonas sp. RW-G-Af-16 TaxID=3241168 RepID=UPI00390CAD10